MDKGKKIIVEEEDKTALNDLEEGEEVNHRIAAQAFLYLVGIIVIGFLVLYSIEKINDSSEVRKIEMFVNQVNSSFSATKPLPASKLESYEYDLGKYKNEQISNKKLVKTIDATLINLQKQQAIVQTGVQIKSWATDLIIRTEIDSIIVTYADRPQNPVRIVYQPANPTESKAYEIYQVHPDWSKEVCLKIANKQIWSGMTQSQILLSWGHPKSIDKDNTYNRNSEQWAYGNYGPFVYLENGIVTSWQE